MAKVITANMARTFAGKFTQFPTFQKTMETILLKSLQGGNSVFISRGGCSTEEWEISQCWLIGLEYSVEATSTHMTVSW